MAKDSGGGINTIAHALTIGINMTVVIVAGYFVGSYLDRRWGTDPWLTLVCFILGVILGLRIMYRMAFSPQARMSVPVHKRPTSMKENLQRLDKAQELLKETQALRDTQKGQEQETIRELQELQELEDFQKLPENGVAPQDPSEIVEPEDKRTKE